MSDTKSWYSKGADGFKVKDQIDATMAVRKERGVPRFMLKAGEEAIVAFCDSIPFFIWEHNLKIGGRWGNYVTCVKEIRSCPIDDSGERATYTGYLTVIDTREFIRNDGNKVKNRKILYPAKGSTIKRLEDLMKKYGTLAGRAFKIKRYSKDDPNCGTDFEFLKQVTLKGDNAVPVEYDKILAPPTPEELVALGFTSNIAGQQTDTGLENLATGTTVGGTKPGDKTATELGAGATATNSFEDLF